RPRGSTHSCARPSCLPCPRAGDPMATCRACRAIPGAAPTTTPAATAVISSCARWGPTTRQAARARTPTWTAMRPERGFTLLETRLALASGGLVLGAAYAAVVRAASARDRAVARGREVNAGRQALLEVAHALEAAAPRRLSADPHALHFVQPEPEPVAITYE